MDCNILSDHKENSNRIILLNLIFLCIWEFITAIYLSTNSYLEIEEASRLMKPANFIRGGVLFWSQTFWWQQYRLVETEDINWKKKNDVQSELRWLETSKSTWLTCFLDEIQRMKDFQWLWQVSIPRSPHAPCISHRLVTRLSRDLWSETAVEIRSVLWLHWIQYKSDYFTTFQTYQ